MAPKWTHLIRFIAVEDGLIHRGQLFDTSIDVGLACKENKRVQAKLINGSAFDGNVTSQVMTVDQVRLPCLLLWPSVPNILLRSSSVPSTSPRYP